jgi:multidrug efflux pump subunit AcrA (membrane-fusion protein)
MKKGMMMKTKSVFVFALVLIALFAGCKKEDAAKASGAAQDKPTYAVSATEAAEGAVWDYLPLSGDIVAGSTVDVYSDVAGKVTRVYVDAGSRVARGDPVAAVDPSKPGMDYVPGIARAPISGIVVSMPAQVGMTVSQAVSLARIAGDSTSGRALEITLYVAERFISKVAMNQPCEITLDAWPGETFRGSVTEVSPVVDPTSRTMQVKLNVENPSSKLKAGMFAKVKLIIEQKADVVKIPSSAMVQRFGENYVFIAEKAGAEEQEAYEKTQRAAAIPEKKKGLFAGLFGKNAEETPAEEIKIPQLYFARKRVIKPGILIDQILEVQDGLKPGETVVVRGQTLLDDGAQINVVDRVNPLPSAPNAGTE